MKQIPPKRHQDDLNLLGRINVRIPAMWEIEIEELAKARHIEKSDVVRQIIGDALKAGAKPCH